jgi:hypothetical protein
LGVKGTDTRGYLAGGLQERLTGAISNIAKLPTAGFLRESSYAHFQPLVFFGVELPHCIC